MQADVERNLGPQPVARLLAELGLKPHDLVASAAEPMTHKMITRACKGRRLTPRAQAKVLAALRNEFGGHAVRAKDGGGS